MKQLVSINILSNWELKLVSASCSLKVQLCSQFWYSILGSQKILLYHNMKCKCLHVSKKVPTCFCAEKWCHLLCPMFLLPLSAFWLMSLEIFMKRIQYSRHCGSSFCHLNMRVSNPSMRHKNTLQIRVFFLRCKSCHFRWKLFSEMINIVTD